jgi:chromosome segregation ATPase
VEGVLDDPPAFADAQAEQELWGELRSHGATLNRALNEALRVHGGPAWHVFQVGHRCSFSSSSRFLRVVSVSGCLRVLTCGRQELERRARDKYGAFDRVNAELHQVRERCGAFDALADALRTPDGWLAYRATVLRDELPESTRQDPARRSSLERICTAVIDRDEALWQARSDLEKMRTLATNWETEVAGVRGENRELRSSLEGAQAQQRQAEERARRLEQRAKAADN